VKTIYNKACYFWQNNRSIFSKYCWFF